MLLAEHVPRYSDSHCQVEDAQLPWELRQVRLSNACASDVELAIGRPGREIGDREDADLETIVG